MRTRAMNLFTLFFALGFVSLVVNAVTGDATSRPASLAFQSDPTVAGLVSDKFAKVFAQRGMTDGGR